MRILDLYDDPSASVLRGHIARTGGGFHKKLASMAPDAEKLAHVPDHLFALVGTCGGEKLRKYAMHDPEHLATSIVYFLECGGQLDKDVQTKVAMNLITACGWYETPPPLALTKVAYIGSVLNTGLALTDAPGKIRKTRAANAESDASFRAAQMAGIKEAQRPVNVYTETGDEAWKALDKFLRGEDEDDTAKLYQDFGDGYPNPFADRKHLMKEANLIGTEVGSHGGLSNDPRSKTPQKRFATAPKVAAPLSTAIQPIKDLAGHKARANLLSSAAAAKDNLAGRLRSMGKQHFDKGEYAQAARYNHAGARAGARRTQLNSTMNQEGLNFNFRKRASNDVGEIHFLAPRDEEVGGEYYALPHRALYPIDTPEQVKRASAYFEEYGRDFTMDDRRVFAQSVAERAGELAVPVSATLRKIASNEYGAHIVPELKGRIAALEGTGKEAAYEVLLENLDQTPPIVMYDMLKIADKDSGMDNGYGRPVTGFKDPLSAVFGAPEAPIYSWAGKGAYVTEEILRSYSKLVPDMDKVIEKDWSNKFVDDPVKAFSELPDAKKIVVARLANGEAFRWI